MNKKYSLQNFEAVHLQMANNGCHLDKIKTYISETKEKKPVQYGPIDCQEAKSVTYVKRFAKDFSTCDREIPVESNGEIRNSQVQDRPSYDQKPNNRKDTCQNRLNKSTNIQTISECGPQKPPQTKTDSKNCPEPLNWRTKQVQKTVDSLVDRFKSSCCGICPSRETKVPCESYRDLLKFVRDKSGSSNRACRQTDGDYERDIIEEIQRRMALRLCGSAPKPQPTIDFIKAPKKRTLTKKAAPPPKEKKPQKPPRVRKPNPPKPPKPTPPPMYGTKVFTIDDTPAQPGTIRYRLSDEANIAKGWTQLPRSLTDNQKTLYTFEAEPCGPLLDPSVWRKKRSLRYYPDGRTMARIEPDGRVEVYYQNCGGDLAVQVSPVGERHHRLAVFFNKDEHGQDKGEKLSRNDLPAAIFDSFGNGVVYDTKGKTRLLFDQAEGKLFDFPARSTVDHPPLHWRWQTFQHIVEKRQALNSVLSCPKLHEEHASLKQYLPQSRSKLTSAKGTISARENSWQEQFIDSKSVVSVKRRSNEPHRSKSNAAMKKTKIHSGSSSERSKSPSTHRSISSTMKTPPKAKRSKKLNAIHKGFEYCASDLEFPGPVTRGVASSKGVSSLETPIRLVMRIERGVSLVIMDQCHIHLTFQEGRKHLIFNLGVRVKTDEPLQSKDTVKIDSAEVASPQDMFSIYAHNSTSLKNLLQPHHSAVEKQESSCKGGGPRSTKGGEKTCLRPVVLTTVAAGPSVRRGSPRIVKEPLACDSFEDKLAVKRGSTHGDSIEKWMRSQMKQIVDQLSWN